MAHELRIQVAIPLGGDAIARAKDVAAFEPTLDAFAEAVARTGGQITVDVVRVKPRSAQVTTGRRWRRSSPP